MNADILTTITKPDGYQYVGHWTADAELTRVLQPGEIAVTEVFAQESFYSRMAFFNEWFELTGYMPSNTR